MNPPTANRQPPTMLTAQEILKKVRELEIKSKRLTRHLFTGEYHSAFKGRGMAFREVANIIPETMCGLLTGMFRRDSIILSANYSKKKENLPLCCWWM